MVGPTCPHTSPGDWGLPECLDRAVFTPVPPREPVLSCRSNTYPKGFYCSWHLPIPTYIPNTFNVTVM